MKKRLGEVNSRFKSIILTIAAVVIISGVILPLSFSSFPSPKAGNVALIPIEGTIVGSDNSGLLGEATVSSSTIIQFIEEADKNPLVEVILLEINSPGGSAVASDEIAAAIKKTTKPVVSLIREVGASGGYWIASATEFIMANRMSITGSIGVLSSYLEFSGLMDKYGVGYERLIAGDKKDLGTPFRKMTLEERTIFQAKLGKIHDFFIEEVSENRRLTQAEVRKIATGEFFLGVEAKELGLIDALGDKTDLEKYLKEKYQLKKISYARYELRPGLFSSLTSVIYKFFFNIGEGIGSVFLRQNHLSII